MRILAPAVVLLVVAGSFAFPVAPAAAPVALPFADTFQLDSIASGVWERTSTSLVSATIANGDLSLSRVNPAVGGGGGGVRKPWTSTTGDIVIEAHVTPRTIFRFGIGLTLGTQNVLLEGDNIGWLLGYESPSGGRQYAHLPVSPQQNVEHFVRLVLRSGAAPYAEVWNGAQTTRLGTASGSAAALVGPSNADHIVMNVWRDGTGDAMSSYTVHDVSVRRAEPRIHARALPGYDVDAVQPNGGDAKTLFDFQATVTGFSPTVVQVVVDGVAKPMQLASQGSIYEGAHYRAGMQLGPFEHAYHLEASDGTRSARYPASGELTLLVGPLENERKAPLMFVPGFNPGSILAQNEPRGVKSYFQSFPELLERQGWDIDAATFWGYYNCDHDESTLPGRFQHLDAFGKPDPLGSAPAHWMHLSGNDNGDGRTYADNHRGHRPQEDRATCPGLHDTDTSIQHLAYHWAWGVAEYERVYGWPCVKVVAHSMGGQVVRYAIAAVQEGRADFPTHLCVDAVVTLGSPHDPGSDTPNACAGFLPSYQCRQLAGVSPFYDQLETIAGRNPQGTLPRGSARGTTNWTVIGSDGDRTIQAPYSIALAGAAHRVLYHNEQLGHGDYFAASFGRITPQESVTAYDANVVRDDDSGPDPYLWTDLSLVYGDWGCGALGQPGRADDRFPLLKGVAVSAEPLASAEGCGYRIDGVPAGATLVVRLAAPGWARGWSVSRVDGFGAEQVCTQPATVMSTCTYTTVGGGTFHVDVDLVDGDGGVAVVPFVLDARW